ncbi:MAG: DUF3313 domain-containing protein [Gammaproteobacteria bacterium]|nr:DUF3313 domain-containing protein [Gammaproteobacteria bacterium]
MNDRRTRRYLSQGLLLLVAAFSVVSCVETTVESFRKVPGSRADSVYVKSGVDFSRFSKLRAAPLEIYFTEGPVEPDPGDLARLRKIFRDAFLAAIGSDYELVDESGPEVLGVRASLVDLDLTPVTGAVPVKGRAASLVANGQLSFFMELTDSQSGEVLARGGDQEKAATEISTAATDRDWKQTEAAASRWAQMFRDFLDENLGS